ncbi:HU family DNA-binding protein [Denitromonas halophila]|uniref:HU family DNA-binding protein n=1 Tax=Denitromonas halophila TaxID=1629404 RepID=A0A557QXJ0_9RHOO|nr:HU family DNA-binding protein [Denitromonas halophila]TVO57556.1 HU family DNA-binding protein [Denitromonas halophila]
MNKAELITQLQIALDHRREQTAGSTTKKEAEQVLTAIADVIEDGISAGEAILPRIGKFKAVERPARTGRNPQTGEPVQIAASTAVKFVPAKQLKDFLNA